MRPGDIVIIPTVPPHIASVCGEGIAICEDGTEFQLEGLDVTPVCTALDVIKALEEGVLKYHETR